MDFIGYYVGQPDRVKAIGFFGLLDFVGYPIGISISKVGFIGLLDFTGCSVGQKISYAIMAIDGE